MRITKMLIPIGMILLLAGCVPQDSLNPLFTDRDAVFDSALVGTWTGTTEDEDKDRGNLMFQESGEAPAYSLIATIDKDPDNGNQVQIKYKARLLRLGGFLFLDLAQSEPAASEIAQDSYKLKLIPPGNGNGFEPHLLRLGDLAYLNLVPQESGDDGAFELRVVQAHWFFRIWIEGDVLRLAYLDDDWVKEMIDQGNVDIDHERVGKGIVLTASTEALRKFVLDHVEDEGAFKDAGEWHRQEK